MFCLDPTWTYLNHGSYGATFRVALGVQSWYREQLERQPVVFMESTAVTGVAKAAAMVAELVGADWRDVVPVVNATGAVNAVVNSLQIGPGDLLLMCNSTYPAVRSTLARAAARSGAELLEVCLTAATIQDDGAVIGAFQEALALARERRRRVRLAVVDHCASFPPVIMPVVRLCELLREEGVPVLLDGAHGIGAISGLDVPSTGCQYYVSNAHKWLCSPKGSAFLWVRRDHQSGVVPLATSHGAGLGFRAEFLWQGTSDPTAWLAVPASLAAMEQLGGLERVAARNHKLVREAAEMLRSSWGTEAPALGVGGGGRGGGGGATAGLAALRLPDGLRLPASARPCAADAGPTAYGAGASPLADEGEPPVPAGAPPPGGCVAVPPTPEGAVVLQRHLREAFRIEVPVACMEGHLYCRISAQVYNNMEQYKKLAEAVNSLRSNAAIGSGG